MTLAQLDIGIFASVANYILEEVFDRKGGYSFAYCDFLANKLCAMLENSDDVEIRARAILALLILGTYHNRWYVERLFCKHAGPLQSYDVIKRIIVEASIREIDVTERIEFCFRSINASPNWTLPETSGALSFVIL